MMRLTGILALLLLAAPAAAQQPSTLVDSVADLPQAALVGLYRAAPHESAAAADHFFHGLVARRLFELSPLDDDVREAAQRSFDRAKDRDPDNAWAHYGYGWALARAGELRIPLPGLRRIVTMASLGEVVGLDATSRAQRAMRHALELQPTLEPAAVDLGRIALATRSPEDADEAADAITTVLQSGGGSADSYLVLAELQVLRGEMDLAAEAARAAVALRNDPLTRRVLALTLMGDGGDAEAAAAHYLGAIADAPADTAMLAAYEADILPIVQPGELEEWRALEADARAPWLQRFWERRAANAVLPVSERISEHFERMRTAHVRFQRNQDYGGRPGEALLLKPVEDLPFDDRGMVYVRYGEPDTTISSPPNMDGVPPANETWVYFRAGEKPLSFNFFKVANSTDWVIAEPPRCYPVLFVTGQPGAQEPQELRNKHITVEDFARWYEDRAFLDTRHLAVVTQCRALTQNLALGTGGASGDLAGDMTAVRARQLEIDREVFREVADALRTEDARPSYDNPLPLLTTVYSLRGENGTDLTTAILIPSDDFTASRSIDGVVYPLRLSLVLHDSVRDAVTSSHEVQRFGSAEDLPEGKYFRAMVHEEVAPFSRGEMRLRVENAGNADEGQVQVGAQTVLDFSGDELQLSDLVVAEAEGGRWQRGATRLSPIPTHQVETGRSFRLFYEIYNLPAQTPYRTALKVSPAEARGTWDRIRSLFGRGRTIELQFDDVAGEPRDKFGHQEVRTIGADLAPGRYTITITVTNLADNTTVERTTPLNVIEIQGT